MPDSFEIDFLAVETQKSGDAITLRYELGGQTYIHVVDGGFQDTGASVATHLRQFYGYPPHIDYVIVTHQDGDHAGGLRYVLEEFSVGELWMHRPWLYAGEIIHRFATYSSVDHLSRRLRAAYPNFAALEEIAVRRGLPIREPFQGARIGAFTVLAPSRARFLDLVVESDKTPEAVSGQQESLLGRMMREAGVLVAEAVALVKSAWGAEVFSPQDTSSENEMSVVQYANLCGTKILLTGDVGRAGLEEAANYAPYVGLQLPGIDRFQVPHHGSRRNVSTELLDRWLGPRLAYQPAAGQETFHAIVSAAKEDEHHPRKAVVRAMIHRGGRVFATEGNSISCHSGGQSRPGWGPATPSSYPNEQEE